MPRAASSASAKPRTARSAPRCWRASFPARMRSTVLGAFSRRAHRLGARRRAGRRHRRALGLAGGFRRGRHARLVLALLFSLIVRDYKTVALPSTAAPAAGVDIRARRRRRTAAATHGAHHLRRRRLATRMVSTTWAWMPSYFNRYYGLAPDQAGIKTGLVVLMGGVGAICGASRRSAVARASACAALRPAPRIADGRLHVLAFAMLSAGQRAVRVDRRRRDMMTGSIGPVCAVVVDVVHPRLRATAARMPVAHAEPVRPRRRAARHRFPVGRYGLPFALSVVPAVLPARGRDVRRRRAHVRIRSPEGRKPSARPARRTQAPGRLIMKNETNSDPSNGKALARSVRSANAGDGQLESRLGAVREARPGVDREGHRDGDRAGGLGRARRQDDGAHRHRARRSCTHCTRPACAGTSSAR